jgi:RNA polymerase sigma-70 factor (ECF subfamily)
MKQEKSQRKKILGEEGMIDHPSSQDYIEKFPLKDKTEGEEFELLIRKKFEADPTSGCSLLFRRYYGSLCSHAVRFVYSKEIAEDIVGDIFFDFWKNKQYELIQKSYSAYLFKTVRNRCLNYLKSNLNLHSKISLQDANDIQIEELPEDILHLDDLVKKINDAVNNLPPICRKVFLLHRFEGKKQKEIAEELGLSLRTIEAHIYKALQLLKVVISEKN